MPKHLNVNVVKYLVQKKIKDFIILTFTYMKNHIIAVTVEKVFLIEMEKYITKEFTTRLSFPILAKNAQLLLLQNLL